MAYRVRRIDPFWIAHPAVIAAAVIGLVLALLGYSKGNPSLSIVGGVLLGIGVLVATKPAVTGVLATLGFFGGVVNFVVLPNAQLGGASLPWKLVSTLFFALLYTVLMEALVLVVAALYNLFAGTMNAGALELEIEDSGPDSAEG
jgi:hypothetical protein